MKAVLAKKCSEKGMNNIKNFEIIQEVVRKILTKSPRCHDWEHTMRVLHNAQMLLSMEENCNVYVVEFAAILHDVARASEKKGNMSGCHAKRGAEIAAAILKKEDFDEDFIEKVVSCVRRHRYRSDSPPETLEEKLYMMQINSIHSEQ